MSGGEEGRLLGVKKQRCLQCVRGGGMEGEGAGEEQKAIKR